MTDSTRKIKICFVSPKAYPIFNNGVKATFGGAEVDLYYLGTELAKDPDYEISFITADYGQDDIERHENVTIIKSLNFDQNPIIGAIKIWNALKKANADMYMIKSISAGLFLLTMFCRLHRKIFLYRTAHTTHCDGTYLQKHPVMGRLFARSLKHAKAVFTQNTSDQTQLNKTVGIEATVIPNGHRIASLPETEKQTILWVGRSADFKHPERYIELASAYPHERFVMICQKATGDLSYE
ncbi:MAG: glycosyltransferase family 4 protein, partial [Planctomycetota bacterium]